jgi:hypothetical protein
MSFGEYTFFRPGAGSAMLVDAACPDGHPDRSATRAGATGASPPAPPTADGGGLTPSGVAGEHAPRGGSDLMQTQLIHSARHGASCAAAHDTLHRNGFEQVAAAPGACASP